ncbi:SigE family RNA polymerase sigma factor [Isoptericola sp. NPDC056134]|uniref:SigE family RNA polymerase sigma factor n=1 Tax=Isoptericola sp. NPDC056134 TaxID=3345723 RepID=UPI0035EECD56
MTVTMTARAEADPPDDVGFLLLRTGATSEEEFTSFMRDAAPALARTAWLLCGDAHLADELVQQALTRTYLRWSTAREGDPLAYARRVLANLRIDLWRKRRHEVVTAPAELPEGAARRSDADHHADRDRLVRALATLSTRQRRIVVLRHLVGLTEREVAADLGVSVGTVKSTASRGLAQLRSVLEAADGSARAERGGAR